MRTGILLREPDRGSQAGVLGGHPPDLVLLCCCGVLCSNMQPAENENKYEGDFVAQYGKNMQHRCKLENDLFNQRFS